jgi:hypothetical protein
VLRDGAAAQYGSVAIAGAVLSWSTSSKAASLNCDTSTNTPSLLRRAIPALHATIRHFSNIA